MKPSNLLSLYALTAFLSVWLVSPSFASDTVATRTISGPPSVMVQAACPGEWANGTSEGGLFVLFLQASSGYTNEFRIVVVYHSPETSTKEIVEDWDNLTIRISDPLFVPIVLTSSDFIRWNPRTPPAIPGTLNGPSGLSVEQILSLADVSAGTQMVGGTGSGIWPCIESTESNVAFRFEGDITDATTYPELGCNVSVPSRFTGCSEIIPSGNYDWRVSTDRGWYRSDNSEIQFGDCKFSTFPEYVVPVYGMYGVSVSNESSSWSYEGTRDEARFYTDAILDGLGNRYVRWVYEFLDSSGEMLDSEQLPFDAGSYYVAADRELELNYYHYENNVQSVSLIYGEIDTITVSSVPCGLSSVTPTGEDVVVQPPPEDENGAPIEDAPAISLTFGDITKGGETTVVVTEPGAGTTSAPSGFRITGLTGAPVLFDIDTTATLAEGSMFEVCFDYSGMNVAGSPDKMALMHEVGGQWTDITSFNDTTNFIICGIADSFSYFAIVEALEVLGPTAPLALGTITTVGIDIGDPTFTDTVIWNWGDGLTTEVSVSEDPNPYEVVGSHTYGEAGVYTVRATLVQSGLEAGYADFQYVVVYDPTAGFVTGGGWFNSPVGAYLADAGLVGKANFGFVSKYKKGAIIPTGTTEFQFKAGYLSFRSLEYQWLVIAGSRAQFKGVGTINGVGNFGFMLTAVDEALTPSTDVDLFRIKIWDIDNGDGVVYDNGLGDADDGDAATAIDGGSIVIHKPKK